MSTAEQDEALQLDVLHAAGCVRVYTDHVFGVASRRPQFERLTDRLETGDTFVVWRLDRLGRSLKHLIEVITELGRAGRRPPRPLSVNGNHTCADQQFPMERAFSGPHLLAQRLGVGRLDAAELAAMDADALTDVFRSPPALHRYPGAMAGRTQAVCRLLVERYGGAADALWITAGTGTEVVARVAELPGFGSQKARIFTALLGKQFGVEPEGWREAAEPYGTEGTAYSIADVTSAQTLAAVREHKQQMKAEAKAADSAAETRPLPRNPTRARKA